MAKDSWLYRIFKKNKLKNIYNLLFKFIILLVYRKFIERIRENLKEKEIWE